MVRPEDVDLWDELFADSDSDGDETFEGFELDPDSDNTSDTEEDVGFEDPFSKWTLDDRQANVPKFEPMGGKTGVRGHLLPAPDETTALICFQLYFPETSFATMTEETNRYAHEWLRTHQLKPHSRFKNFKDVTVHEMKAFIGLIVAMGVIKQLDIQDYWSTNEVIKTPFFLPGTGF